MRKMRTKMNDKKFTLRYKVDAPIQPRPHEPTVAKFDTYGEALEHLEKQPEHLMLEVVER
jgi:hypothetical protein